jgi:hypothetical protein
LPATGRNDDYFGGVTLEPGPIYASQLHVRENLGNGIWVALSGTFDYGGRTTLDGVQSDDLQSNSRVGATFCIAREPGQLDQASCQHWHPHP